MARKSDIFATSVLQWTKESTNIKREHESFRWSEVLRGIFNISTWLSAAAYFGILASLYSFGLFVSSAALVLFLQPLTLFSFPRSSSSSATQQTKPNFGP